MALELVPKRIRVNCVSPAMVGTEMAERLFANVPEEAKRTVLAMHPLGVGAPEEVADACVYLFSDAARWVSGSNLVMDGGYSAG